MVVTHEAVRNNGEDHPKLIWMMDIREETNPVIISTFPMPDTEDFFSRGGRFGAHNVYENQPGPTCSHSDTLIYGTFFNAGVRVFDTSDPFRPEEVAYFVPPVRRERRPTASTTSTWTRTASCTSWTGSRAVSTSSN